MKLMIAVILFMFSGLLPAAAAKPNIVFLLVDDLGWADFGCYGAEFHETPNIDRLAAEGMMFSNGYSACTVCSPSRAAIMTGCYPARLHLTDWIAGHKRPYAKLAVPEWKMKIDHERVTLPEALKEGGYNTAFVGKWHLMPNGATDFEEHYPTSHGFDINIGGCEWGQPKGRGRYFSPFDLPGLDDGEPGDFLTDKLTDAALGYIDGVAKESPFLLYFAYYTLHGPIMAPPEIVEKYKNKAETFVNSKNEFINPARAGMVEALDHSVGRIMRRLNDLGIAENTVVILTGDNGGDHDHTTGGLNGYKGFSHEGGVREPFIVKWPGRTAPGSRCDEMVIGTDFYPTMLEMAGLPLRPDQHMDGVSIVPLLEESSERLKRDTLYWHYPHYHRTMPYGAIRHREWKLIEFFEDGALELYNLREDPLESINLAARHPEQARELLKRMTVWRSAVDAQMMRPNPNYDPERNGKKRARPGARTERGTVTASSFEHSNWPENAVDSNRQSRWAARDGSVPQWWQLKLHEVRELKGVNIFWKNRVWFSYKIETSMDGREWSTVVDQSGSREVRNSSRHSFEPRAVRFLRITVDDLGGGWVSFKELEPVFAE